MAKAKPRQIKVEQRGALAAMQRLETRSDDELLAETKFRAAAQAILGARAAERYDAKASRAHFQKAIAAARPQERMQIRRMADASLALAERRPGDLKLAVERLGQEAPSSRQLLGLRLMGIVAPPPGSSLLLRARGILLLLAAVVVLLAIGTGIVQLISLPVNGGAGLAGSVLLGFLLVVLALVVLLVVGRRKQSRLSRQRAEAAAQRAATSR